MSDGMVVDVQDDIIEFEELFEWFPDTLVSIPPIDDGALLERKDFPHAASFQVRPLYLHLLHFAYGSGDTICDRQRIRLFPVDEVAEPMEGNLHTDAAYTGSALRCRGFMGFLVFVPTSAASAKYHSRLPRKRSTLLFRLFPSPP